MRTIEIAVVKGSEGYSLQLWDKSGGYRVAGPKAWGNPYNEPTATFTVDADELIRLVNSMAVDDNIGDDK